MPVVRGLGRNRFGDPRAVTDGAASPGEEEALSSLPDDVQGALVRGIGAFLRAAHPQQLPSSIRRFRSWRPAALNRHRPALLGALEDDDFRAALLEWLEDGRPPLSNADIDILRTAAERPTGWGEHLAARTEGDTGETTAPSPDSSEQIARARERTKKAREDARRAREGARAALLTSERERAELARERDELRAELASTREAAASLRSEVQEARDDADRRIRRATRERDRLRSETAELRTELKGLRRSLAAAQRGLDSGRPPEGAAPPPVPQPAKGSSAGHPRRPLPVPKGRLPEDPETLDEWLDRAAWLLVDGYNVTKAEGGFATLPLEAQRDRLTEEVKKLATRKQVPTTIVFDGSRVPPGTKRRQRGPVAVEYSRPEELADDHLIELLETRRGDSAVLVSSDRELQQRAAALGATAARSEQLLALIR